jgi:hypothetical protein
MSLKYPRTEVLIISRQLENKDGELMVEVSVSPIHR